MKDKLYDPARNNEKAPEKGMAAVNTHNEEEAPITDMANDKPLLKNDEQDINEKDAKKSSGK